MDLPDRSARDSRTRARIEAAPNPLAILSIAAAGDGDKPAMQHWRHPADPDPQTWTYRNVVEAAGRLAASLKKRGVGGADTVAIIAPSVPETMIALIAVTSIAVAFPINLLLSAESMAAQLALAKAKAVITFGAHPRFDLNQRVAAAVGQTPCVEFMVVFGALHGASPAQQHSEHLPWERFLAEATPIVEAEGPAARAAALFHTGGTTGAPKLAELSLEGVTAGAHMSAAGLGIRASDRVFMLLPFFHVGGAITAGLALFCASATLLTCGLAGGRNPDLIKTIWQTAEAMDATILAMVPSTWSVVATLPPPRRWAGLRGMATGAASMAPDLALNLEAAVGVPMSQVFGMSEASGVVSVQPVDGIFREPAVGDPVPLLDIRLEPIAEGGPNEVMLSGPNLFRGYRTQEGLVESPVGGWIASGDLGAWTRDGQLRLVGRRKDVIVRSGHNIDPLSIEDVACSHPGVLAAAAVGMPDVYAGELPVLYVVRRHGADVSTGTLEAYVAERVAEPPARPRRLFFVDELPMTPIGKIARYRLRQAAAVLKASEALAHLSPGSIACTDHGARVIAIDWPEELMPERRAEADALLQSLGLRTEHRAVRRVASSEVA